MKGYPVVVWRTSWRLPREKHSVTSMMNPNAPLKNKVASMILGIVFEALRTSSDMCTAASGPMRANCGLKIPIRAARPVLRQLPPSLKVVNTSRADDRGARTQRGTRMAMKPKT